MPSFLGRTYVVVGMKLTFPLCVKRITMFHVSSARLFLFYNVFFMLPYFSVNIQSKFIIHLCVLKPTCTVHNSKVRRK